ncbi:hypothetical protein M5X11_12475 [Paenibacillus alginolyticus]|uniref:hypothetical protein n=1 Tax=Paenibacillus alginolyticus TaxID=59839 RepID=UPI000492CCE7|nr:hypothetical protein [Paenibacillus alginolyticus]MCY9665771.1 hypothetical protein [Paenibacillus alginolyticus]
MKLESVRATTVTTHSDERLKLLSLCAGAGLGSASFLASEYFRPVMEVEFEYDSAGGKDEKEMPALPLSLHSDGQLSLLIG